MRHRLEHTNRRACGLDRAAAALCAAALAVACVLGFSPAALAAPAATPAQPATLTLNVGYTSGGKTTPIAGATAMAYPVADLDDAINHYTLRDDFAALGVNFDEGVADAATMEALAAQAADIAAASKPQGFTAVSGADGKASFGALPYGMYLVVETDSTGDAANYTNFTPFLISVPQLGEEGITFDVVVLPKLAPKPPEKSPQTSDPTNPLIWRVCLAVGGALVLVGLVGRRKLDREEAAAAGAGVGAADAADAPHARL